MATVGSRALECPVCHEGFTEPKLLHCAHLVCRKCVLSWLQKGGDHNGCPLCRAPIVQDGAKGQGDFTSLVDALPTDLTTASEVDSEKTLTSDHLCSCTEAAILLCPQCDAKMCSSCAKSHATFLATKGHLTEKLSKLSAEQLAACMPTLCAKHSDKQVELFCSDHEEPLCVLCMLSHRQCSEVAAIGDAITSKRQELNSLVQSVADREATVTTQVSEENTKLSEALEKFKAMREEVTTVFDEVQAWTESRKQKLLTEVETLQESYVAASKSRLLDLEQRQAVLGANKSAAHRLVSTAQDAHLLTMLAKLKARMKALLDQPSLPCSGTWSGMLLLTPTSVEQAKKAVDAIGTLRQSIEGPEFAKIIKVGDRVRRGKDWRWSNQDGTPPGVGTVTAVPQPGDPRWVDVKWDHGVAKRYRMGSCDSYDLKLVFD